MRWFLPKTVDFQDLFEKSSGNIVAAIAHFRSFVEDLSDAKANVDKLKEFEHEGDRLTHQTLAKLNTSFITPFDREDIHALATRLDDILDATDAAGQRIVIYRIEKVPERFVALIDLLLASVKEVQKALVALHDRRKQQEALVCCVEVNRLENEADVLHREALGELFANCTDPIEIMKMKELFSFLEEATDRCEDVTNVVESILIKGS